MDEHKFAMITGIIAIAVSFSALMILTTDVSAEESVTEFRDDGIQIIHNSDGTKIYKAYISDGVISDSHAELER